MIANFLWIYCPICRGKTRIKVYEEIVIIKFHLYCLKCKRVIRMDVVQLKMVLSKWNKEGQSKDCPFLVNLCGKKFDA